MIRFVSIHEVCWNETTHASPVIPNQITRLLAKWHNNTLDSSPGTRLMHVVDELEDFGDLCDFGILALVPIGIYFVTMTEHNLHLEQLESIWHWRCRQMCSVRCPLGIGMFIKIGTIQRSLKLAALATRSHFHARIVRHEDAGKQDNYTRQKSIESSLTVCIENIQEGSHTMYDII